MSPQPHVTRRRFLQAAAAALAAPAVVPASALGQDGATAPSERIALGLIGIGAMGQGHLRCFLGFDDVQVLCVCDVDQWRRDQARQHAEETYASQRTAGTYRGCDAPGDLRDLVDRDDIDAVVVATGDNWHAAASVLAMRGGKDVYCEKPVSLTIHEARAIADTAERYRRVVQIGLQQRSAPEFQRACALVREGAIGKVHTVYVGFPGASDEVNLPAEPVPDGLDWDLWLGPAPWRPFNARFHRVGPPPHVVPWHFCRDFGGGNLTSNAVHAFDVVQWGLGMDRAGPVEVVPPETGRVPCLTYKYPNGVTLRVTWKLDHPDYQVPEGWDRNARIQNFGALFVGERGWVHVGREGFLECFPREILADAPGWPEHRHAVRGHQRGWLDAVRTRGQTLCDAETGCRSTIVAHLGCIAHWTGRALQWDPAAERFLDDEAQRMTWRPMRPPWGV